jgi:chromosome segregation ATPase
MIDFSKMSKNDKIEMCFDYIIETDVLTDKMESSASGVSQSKASIKQNMKRNKSPIFNAMIDALIIAISDKNEYISKHGNMRRSKDREIESLEFRLSEVENDIRILKRNIDEKDKKIEHLEGKCEWCEAGISNMKEKIQEQEKINKSLQEQINKLSNK